MSREHLPASKQTLANCLDKLRAAGFGIREQGQGRFLISRTGCGAVLKESTEGTIQLEVRPGLVQRESIAHLVDHGFQKFWQDGDRRLPARAEELKALHEFQRDLRAALAVTTLYNEALGTVSSKYVYDRVEGREPGKRHQSFD
ncbi:MAG: hypothetical protein HY651_05535 [Acidobacteria bacterium]|nr:hypothetical protein [Acidobacteriota bacterium]